MRFSILILVLHPSVNPLVVRLSKWFSIGTCQRFRVLLHLMSSLTWCHEREKALRLDVPQSRPSGYILHRGEWGSELEPPTAYERKVTFYAINILNASHSDWVRRHIARRTALATRAAIEFEQFSPSQRALMPKARQFRFLGRWGPTPKPGVPPSQLQIRRGQRLDIPLEGEEGVAIIVKYDGDEAAWGFTNESYQHAQENLGLWRHLEYEIPLGTHFRISVTIQTTGWSETWCYHA